MTNDNFSAEIIQSSLRAISDEMFATIAKTAMSPIIYEVLDMATAITDAKGNLASAGSGIPAFVGALDRNVSVIIEKFGLDNIHDGDIFISNDPHYGGVTHLNDVAFVKPVFMDDVLIAWTANIAHWNDVSGKSPGSMSADAKDIFQEGIRIPAVHIFSKGEPIAAVMDIIQVNSRMSDYLKGDMWAQISSLQIGAKRIIEIANKYGVEHFCRAVENYLDDGEAMARKVLEKMPTGNFYLQEQQDDGTTISVTVNVSSDKIRIDLSDAPDQVDVPINLSRDGTALACRMLLLSLVGDRNKANGGCFRVMDIITRPGSIYDVSGFAPCGMYFETMIRLKDLIWRCLATHIPDLLPAGGFSSICATILGGNHPDTGKHFSIIEPEIGGWGASKNSDGANAVFSSMHGDTFNCPAEIAEVRYGVRVNQMALNPEDGGAGQFRGGKGVVIDYQIRGSQAFLTCAYSRAKVPPWPLNGGHKGSLNRVDVIRSNGDCSSHSFESELPLSEHDVVRVITANGAGYGDPHKRDKKLIQRDVENGYVSKSYAAEVYGWAENKPN